MRQVKVMTAEPLIRRIIEAANAAKLDMIIIGNAAAALQGSPISTLDIDFYVRDVERKMPKIRALAERLGAVVVRADSAMSRMVKIENEVEGVFLDLLDRPTGMSSFASVRRRATELSFTGCRSRVYVASMGDVISSKRSLGRPKDLAVLPLLEATLHEQERMSQQGETGY